MRYLLVITFLLSLNSHALEIKFHDLKKNYILKIDDYGIDFKSPFAEYIILEDKCNTSFLNKFKADIKESFRYRAISSIPEKSFYVKKDSEVLSLAKDSDLGRFLFSMDKKVAHLKIKGKVHCE